MYLFTTSVICSHKRFSKKPQRRHQCSGVGIIILGYIKFENDTKIYNKKRLKIEINKF